jgi:hypothetical protein
MSEVKFRADLYKNGQHPGHITISETTFRWKPMLGHYNEVEFPIEDVVGYAKTGFLIWTTLYLEFARYDMIEAFWGGWNVNSIIRELRYRNPNIQEFTVKSSMKWTKDLLWLILAIIGGIIFAMIKG